MLYKKNISTYAKNLIKLGYSKRKICKILDINERTLDKILAGEYVSDTVQRKVCKNYDNFVAVYVKTIK